MRAGWNEDLELRLRRADPAAHVIVEAVVTENEDVRKTTAEWSDADSTTGFFLPSDGSLRLTGGTSAVVSNTSSDTYLTDLDRGSPFRVAMLRWGGTEAATFELDELTLHLVAQRNGGDPKTVAYWKVELWNLMNYEAATGKMELVQIAAPVTVDATGGTTAADVSFDFSAQSVRPKRFRPEGGGSDFPDPTTLVFLYALQDDGSAADNVGWSADSGGGSTGTGNTIEGKILTRDTDGRYTASSTDLPRMAVVKSTYSQTTLTYSTASPSNLLDLGAAPTGTVEMVLRYEAPDGTTVTGEVSDDGVTWVEFVDGDRVGEDNSAQGGQDLSGVAVQQTYYVRATLDPGTAGATPVLREVGVRELSTTVYHHLTTVRAGSWAVDPISLKGEVPEASVTMVRDGVRDYLDAATELGSEKYPADIVFRVWIGHPDLARSKWLHVDDFLVDDGPMDGGGELTWLGISPLALAKGTIPPFSGTQREIQTYAADTLKDVYDDLIDTQIALGNRYKGPGVATTSNSVSRTVTEMDGKAALDQVAYLAGGSVISSQGRVKFVRMHDLDGVGVRAVFFSDEIQGPEVRPGHRYATPEFFVPYNWSDEEKRFDSEYRNYHASSLTRIRRGRIDAPEYLDEGTARWIDTDTLAQAVGRRVVETMGTGLILWSFQSIYPYPELEPGDRVAVQTDRFVARDPNAGHALRGNRWAVAVVTAVHDVLGTRFDVWVQSYADILADATDITRLIPGAATPPPRLHRVQSSYAATSPPTVDILLQVLDPVGLSGSLELWTNKSGTDEPNPTNAADGSVTVQGGQTVGATSLSPDVTTALLDDIQVPDGGIGGKSIFARWTADDGRTTGIVEIPASRSNARTWENEYDVSTLAPASLTDFTGAAVSADYSYFLLAQNLDAANKNSTFASLKSDGSSFTGVTVIGTAPSDDDDPELYLDSGTPKVRLFGSSTTQTVAVTFERSRSVGLAQTDTWQNATSKGQNLLGKDAGPEVSSAGSSFNLQTVTLSDAGLAVGQVVSVAAEVKSDTGTDDVRLELQWRDVSDVQVGTTQVGAYKKLSAFDPDQRSAIENLTIPASTSSIRLVTRNADVTESAQSRRYMLNRGPLALEFEEPPFRVEREKLDDIDGNLPEGATQSDGAAQRVLAKGHIAGTGYVDGDPVTFAQAFQDPPMVILRGGLTYSATLGSSVDQAREVVAQNLSASSFDLRAKVVSRGTVTAQTDTFAGTTLDAEAESEAVNLDPAGASDGAYDVSFDVFLDSSTGDGALLVVAVDSNDGTTGWVERATRPYITGAGETINLTGEVAQINVSDLGLNDDIRVRIKEFTKENLTATDTFEVTANNVTYGTSTDSDTSATPSGYTVSFEAMAVG